MLDKQQSLLDLVYLVSTGVWLASNVAGEDLIDTLFIHQLLTPHLQQCVFG